MPFDSEKDYHTSKMRTKRPSRKIGKFKSLWTTRTSGFGAAHVKEKQQKKKLDAIAEEKWSHKYPKPKPKTSPITDWSRIHETPSGGYTTRKDTNDLTNKGPRTPPRFRPISAYRAARMARAQSIRQAKINTRTARVNRRKATRAAIIEGRKAYRAARRARRHWYRYNLRGGWRRGDRISARQLNRNEEKYLGKNNITTADYTQQMEQIGDQVFVNSNSKSIISDVSAVYGSNVAYVASVNDGGKIALSARVDHRHKGYISVNSEEALRNLRYTEPRYHRYLIHLGTSSVWVYADGKFVCLTHLRRPL